MTATDDGFLGVGDPRATSGADDGYLGAGGDDERLEVEEHFATVPEWVLRAKISARAKALYAVIQRYGNGSGQRMPGRGQLADEWLHCSRPSISRAVAELESIGALRVRRDTRPMKGETRNRPITVNTYVLRVTDPSVTRVMPAFSSSPVNYPVDHPRTTGSSPVRHNRKEDLPPPAPSRSARPRQARPVEEVDIPAEALAALGDLAELGAMIRVRRRDMGLPTRPWRDLHIRRAIAAAIAGGNTAADIPDALLAVALDRETKSPMRLPCDGPWWDVADLQRRADERRRAGLDARLAAARRVEDCPRCDARGLIQTSRGEVRCDHIPDDESETA